MLKRENVIEAIKKNVLGFDIGRIENDEQNLLDAGLDSLDHASVLLTLEEEHGVSFPDEVAGELVTIQAIMNHANAASS